MDGDNANGGFKPIGFAETTLGNIMGSKTQIFLTDLTSQTSHKGSIGKLIVKADSVKESNWEITMRIRAEGLPATTSCLICADNNPFYEIHRTSHGDTGQSFKVYDSDIAQGTRNPVYNYMRITGQ